MAQLIDKDALVAEIEKRREESWLGHYTKEKGITFDITDDILSFINTLEVKEVDLEKESLTWEDISIIRRIMYDYNKQIRNEMAIPKEEYCKEVLKRFLEQKGGDV